MAQLRDVFKNSIHAIEAYHKQFKHDTWEATEDLELFLDLELITGLSLPP